MVYVGSKNRIAKEILAVMLQYRKPSQIWVEPFVGGANLIDKVQGTRVGYDINKYLIALLNAVKGGWVPTEISREEYYDIRNNKASYPDYVVGYAGFVASFSGRWFGGFARTHKGRNRQEEMRKNLLSQAEKLKGIPFNCSHYTEIQVPDNSFIYCDPPYRGTKYYGVPFNHAAFFQWCRDKANEGHTVFVSEYSAPDDFIEVWHKEIKVGVVTNTKSERNRMEKLFLVKGM